MSLVLLLILAIAIIAPVIYTQPRWQKQVVFI